MPRITVTSNKLHQYFPFLNRAKGSLPRGEMLALRPLRSRTVAWTADPDSESPGAQLVVPRREDKLGQILGRLFQVPSTKTIALDELGAAVWTRCDGKHSVEQLIDFTGSTYKLNRRQAEVSVVAFLRMLAQRRLIGLDGGTDGNANIGKGTAYARRSNGSRTPVKSRGRRRH